MTKSEAIQQCANDGARLPVPRSDEENEFFFNLQFNKVNGYGGWVGINDDAQEGTWVADNGDELTWFPWGPNEEPGGSSSGGTGENAVIIEKTNNEFGWHDVKAVRTEGTTCVKFTLGKRSEMTD